MSLQEVSKIDLVGIDNDSGVVKLTLADQFDWSDELLHLELLQKKINNYILFIESGEIHDKYPLSRNRNIEIDLVLRYAPPKAAKAFLDKAKHVMKSAGLTLNYNVFPMAE